MKVIHIVENLDRGSVENSLVRTLRLGTERGVALDWTFYCVVGVAGRLDQEVRRLGGRIVYSPVPIARKARFALALRSELQRGRYDVMHSHHDLISAVYFVAALGLPIKKRVIHVHNSDESVLTPNPIKQAVLRPVLRRIGISLANRVVGVSSNTLDTFLGGRARKPARDTVSHHGIDPRRFQEARGDRQAFRRGLELPDSAKILLFAGRMVPEKNPLFAMDVLAEMRKLDSDIVGVFAGSGSLDEPVKRRAAELGLSHAFHHIGWRDDLPEIMCCCDWFILPHPEYPMEGFGLAVVEAQLAGLRLLISRGVAEDPLLPAASFRRLSLSDEPKTWAEAGMELLRVPAPSRAAALMALGESTFELETALARFFSLHQTVGT